MHQNKISIIINKPIEEVFASTTNPQNTHLWFSSIKEEISSEYPPKINTEYRNRGGVNLNGAVIKFRNLKIMKNLPWLIRKEIIMLNTLTKN